MIYNQNHRRENRTAKSDIGSHLRDLNRTIRQVHPRGLVSPLLKARFVYEMMHWQMIYQMPLADVYLLREARPALSKRIYQIRLADGCHLLEARLDLEMTLLLLLMIYHHHNDNGSHLFVRSTL